MQKLHQPPAFLQQLGRCRARHCCWQKVMQQLLASISLPS